MKIRNLQMPAAIIVMGLLVTVSSCKKNLTPGGQLTTANVYTDFNNYLPVLGKLYDAFAISGQAGGAGNADIKGIDEGFGNYLRELINIEELPTDEVMLQWNDNTIQNIHNMNWTPSDVFITALYDRIYYQIALDNEFIRNTTDAKLASNGITGSNAALVKQYRAEARFLRALAYSHAVDIYGGVPLITENDAVGVFFPVQKTRTEIFNYVESELKAIDGDLGAPRFSYGHADKAAAWSLLAKIYLNATVYTGADRYTDAITYANKVIAAGYTLEPHFKNMFTADNNLSNEMIFPIESDGLHTQGYGGMTYLVHAEIGGSMVSENYGVSSGWGGFRTTREHVALFADPSGNTDKRAQFYTSGQSLNITHDNNDEVFTEGYAFTKFTNLTSTGQLGSDPTGTFVDTDYPVFRLADIYLTYAEAVLRGGQGGNLGQALIYVNAVRTRAYDGSLAGNLPSTAQLDLNFIIAERGRELFMESQRRTDLIRFGLFTSANYPWQWKGGVSAGTGVSANLNLMPIPSEQISLNPTLKQNTGYH